MLRGVRRIRGERAARPRLPITPDILRALLRHWSASGITYDVVMLWAACCLGFFGFLRAGEFTVNSKKSFDPSCHLTPADVSVDSRKAPQMVRVAIRQSKTDPFRRGAKISLGKSGNKLCPVSALLVYLARRGSSKGPLIFSDVSPLSRQRLVSYLRESLSVLGFNCELYSGQLSHWSGDYGCSYRAGRLSYSEFGSLAQRCVPTVHKKRREGAGTIFSDVGYRKQHSNAPVTRASL